MLNSETWAGKRKKKKKKKKKKNGPMLIDSVLFLASTVRGECERMWCEN
jgi:hypothetical protein